MKNWISNYRVAQNRLKRDAIDMIWNFKTAAVVMMFVPVVAGHVELLNDQSWLIDSVVNATGCDVFVAYPYVSTLWSTITALLMLAVGYAAAKGIKLRQTSGFALCVGAIIYFIVVNSGGV